MGVRWRARTRRLPPQNFISVARAAACEETGLIKCIAKLLNPPPSTTGEARQKGSFNMRNARRLGSAHILDAPQIPKSIVCIAEPIFAVCRSVKRGSSLKGRRKVYALIAESGLSFGVCTASSAGSASSKTHCHLEHGERCGFIVRRKSTFR